MSRSPRDLPPRLLGGEGTDFERRMLDALLEKRPSASSSARMARALGVTVTSIGTAATSKALAANVASKASAAAGASTFSAWISAGVLGLVAVGGVVGARLWHHPRPVAGPSAAVPSPGVPPSPSPSLAEAGAPTLAPLPRPTRPPHHSRPAPVGDLGDEIAFVDAARNALSSGTPPRALEILRRYQDRYPSGSFRPEAAAIRIEALLKLGREAEARALARRFVAEHPGSLLAARVADMVGLVDPSAGR